MPVKIHGTSAILSSSKHACFQKIHISHSPQSQTYRFPKNSTSAILSSPKHTYFQKIMFFLSFLQKTEKLSLGTAAVIDNLLYCKMEEKFCTMCTYIYSMRTKRAWKFNFDCCLLHRSQLFCLTLCNIDEARGVMLGYVWLPFYIKACSNIYAPHRAFTASKYTNINIFSNGYVWLPSI